MTQPTAIPVLPVEENVQHKTDNLEWAYLPTHACDLEFRIPLTVSLADHVRVFVLAVGVSALAPLLAVNCRLWLADRLWNWPVLVATLAIAGLLAAGSQLRRTSRSTGEEPSFLSRAAILSLAMPAFAWLSLAMTASVHRPAGGFLYLALVASPAVVFAADQIATHAIFWLTANVQVDYAMLSAWRADWARRYIARPRLTLPPELECDPATRQVFRAVLLARTAYRFGPVWLLASIVLPTFLILLISRRPNLHTIGLQLVIGVCLGLLAAALIRTGGRADTFALFWEFFVHWLHDGKQGTTPPWVFQSPGGPLMGRRLSAALAIGLISVAVSHLALPTVAFVASMPSPSASLSASVLPAEDAGDTAPDFHAPAVSGWSWSQWTLLSVLLLAGALTPVSLFALGTLVLIAPTLSAYHAALED